MILGVVIPVYNTENNDRFSYFHDTIDSIAAQDIDFRCLIVDNGSTDEKTLDFYESLPDSRFEVHKIGRLGFERTPARSLNYGFNFLYDNDTDAFCYLHSDDLLTEDSLEKRLEGLEDNDMVYGRTIFLLDGRLYYRDFPLKKENANSPHVLRNGFPHHSSMWSSEMMGLMLNDRKKILFDTSMKANEDIEVSLYCRNLINERGLNLGFVDYITYIWVDHPGNITNSVSSNIKKEQSRYAFEKNGFQFPSEYTWKHIARHLGSCFIPDYVKNHLRPARDFISEITNGLLFPSKPLRLIDIDPYWFKKKEYEKDI